MAEWFVYLTKCSICLCVLYGFCKCLCAGSTLFGFHRKVMLWGLAVCLCLPLGQWTTERETGVQRPLQAWSGMLAEAWPETPVAAEGQPEMRENRPDGKDSVQGLALLPLIYQAGAVAAFLFYGLCYVRLWRLLRRGERVRGEGWTAILTDELVEPFSVGRFVVMNREDYRAFPLIRLHEQMHIRLRHTWDEVLMQAFTVLFWFHPLAWLLRKDLRESNGNVYSPGSTYSTAIWFDNFGFITAGTLVAPEYNSEIMGKLYQCGRKLVENISEDEFQRAKTPIIKSLKKAERSNRYWLNVVMAKSQAYPIEITMAENRTSTYNRISLSDVRNLARQIFNQVPSQFTVKPKD